jgi:hypothetical protein
VGAIVDPGTETPVTIVIVWGDGNSDAVSNDNTIVAHLYDDDALFIGAGISAAVIDEDGFHSNSGFLALEVENQAPTAGLINGGPVDEGSEGFVLVTGQADPSNADTQAGFTYDFDFNNNGEIEPGLGELVGQTDDSAVVPASFLATPETTVSVVIRDKDGGESRLSTTITVNEVVPGDTDSDDDVDFEDFSVISANFTGTLESGTGGKTRAEGDFDGDGDVDFQDFSILQANFTGNGALTAPLPASTAATVGEDLGDEAADADAPASGRATSPGRVDLLAAAIRVDQRSNQPVIVDGDSDDDDSESMGTVLSFGDDIDLLGAGAALKILMPV